MEPKLRGSSELIQAGTRLDQYRIGSVLGRGGMGIVYEAEDTLLRRRVAVKVLLSQDSDPVQQKHFLREARAVSQLNHPNIVKLFQVGEWQRGIYLVLEVMDRGSLAKRIELGQPMKWKEATIALVHTCKGIAHAHKMKCIHRDIKPANLLIDDKGKVKISDFGLVVSENLTHSSSSNMAGTPAFMSPEQCRGEPVDERSDIYCLGVTYFALLTGGPPYVENNPMQVMFAHCTREIPDPRTRNRTVPDACCRLIKKATAKEPSARFQSANDFLKAAKEVLNLPESDEELTANETHSNDENTFSHLEISTVLKVKPKSTRRWFLIGGGIATGLGLFGIGVRQLVLKVGENNGSTTPQEREIERMAFSKDGTYLAVGDKKGVTVWNAKQEKEIRTLDWGAYPAVGFTILSPDNKLAVCGGTTKSALVWVPSDNSSNTFIIGQPSEGWGTVGAIGSGDRFKALGYVDGSLARTVICYEGPNDIRRLTEPELESIQTLHISMDEKQLAAVCGDTMLLWEKDRWDLRKVRIAKNGGLVAISQNFETVVIGGESNLRLIDISGAKKEEKSTSISASSITAMIFSPNHQLLVTGTDKGEITLWDVKKSQKVTTIVASGPKITTLAVNQFPHPPILASREESGKIRFWNLSTSLPKT